MVFWRGQRSQDKLPPAERPPAAAPPSAAERQVRRRWTRAVGASLLWHAVFLPLALPRLMTPAEQDIEVAYLPDVVESDSASDDSQQPEKELPAEPDRREARLPEPEKKKDEEKKKEKEKPLDVVKLPDLPMVDQEQFPDEKDNEKAHFLAQKNHRAAEDMQAKDRTLEKPPPADSLNAPQGEPTVAPAPTAPEQRVAELLPQPSPQPPKPVPQMAPMQMRQPTPGGEQGEVQQLSDTGEVNPTRPGASKPGGSDGPPPLSPSRLGPLDYDKLIGSAQAQAERRAAALADRTGVPGHWDRLMAKQNALKSALENFVGNVRTGNQSELGTRKHPFAAFITQMHRQIHRFWGDGFLADLERRSRDNTYPMSLITALEICVLPDGTLDGVIIVKPSGSLPFDAAAIDAVTSAAPFDKPPDAIKSRDGKVYLTWSFHRDERQCHPNYVDMHILTTPGKPSSKPPALAAKPTAPESSEADKPRLAKADFTKGLPNPAAASPFAGRGGTASPGGAPAAAKSSTATASAHSESAPASPPAAPSKPGPAVTDAAREATEQWLSAYAKADVRWLAGASGLPFTAGGKQVADDGPTLRRFFQDMLAEGVPRRERVTYYTQSQIKAKRGKLPRGGDEDDMVFAWVELAGEDMILLLSPTDRGWSVVGLDR